MSQSKKALDAILNEGISVHEACLRFGISRAAISKEKLHPSAKSILEKQVYVLNEQCVFKDKTIDKLNCETKQLRAELAAAKAEIESLRADCLGLAFTQDPMFPRYTRHIEQKDKELAARDLVIKQMREALIKTQSVVKIVTFMENEKVIALKPTQEALDEFVQRAKEEVRDKCAAKCDEAFADNIFTTHDAAIIGMATTKCAAAIRGMEL